MAATRVYCSCGMVEARIDDLGPRTCNRVVCYCDDCQAFAHHLGRTDLLDHAGGTDIVQVAPRSVTFTKGMDQLVAVRLSPNGLYRWYARCCRTPMGNTVGPKLPFIGFVAQAVEDVDAQAGRPIGAILGRYATGGVPKKFHGMPFGLVLRAVSRVAFWKLSGKSWPNPFFDRKSGAASYPVEVITAERRAALRALCGPRPAAG